MTKYMSVADFAAKVEWEGGITAALEYGLKHTHLDPGDPKAENLRDAWAELERIWESASDLMNDVGLMLEDAVQEEE